MSSTLCFLATVLAILTIPLAVIAWFLETPPDKARRWHRAGVSQRQIALRLNVSRRQVSNWVAT
jgi:hypothetical protein